MDYFKESFLFACIALTVLCILVSVFTYKLFRRYYPEGLISGDAIRPAALIGTIIGSLFGLLLALVVVNAWQNYDGQKKRLAQEAVVLGNLYRDARGFDPVSQKMIQDAIIDYTNVIITDAWPAMAEGKESQKSWISFNHLYSLVLNYTPTNNNQEVIFIRSMENLNQLASFRRLRVFTSLAGAIPSPVWGSLVILALISVFITMMFRISNDKVQITIMSLHVSTIAVIISIIYLLDTPFRGGFKLTPFQFQHLLEEVYPVADLTSGNKQNIRMFAMKRGM